MKKIIVFAVNRIDAQAKAHELGVEFEQVTWVMNWNLLGYTDLEGAKFHFTDAFKDMPAYDEARAEVERLG